MTARTRLTIIYLVTLAVAGAGFGYTIGRLHKWHDRGWTGVAFYPELPQPKKMKAASIMAPGSIMLIQARSPADGVLQPHDRILAVNGVPLRDISRLRTMEKNLPRDATVRYTVEREGKTIDVPLRFASPLRTPYIVIKTAVAFVVALLFVSIALLVYQRRPDDRLANVFFAFALVSALALLSSAATLYEKTGGRGIVPTNSAPALTTALFFIVTVAYAPLILHLALIFPRERPIVAKHPHLVRWIYAGAVVAGLFLVALFLMMIVYFQDPTSRTAAYQAGFAMARISFAVAIGGLLIALQIMIAGRGEGILARFATRPFRAVLTIFSIAIAIDLLIGQYVSGFAAGIAAVLLFIVPALLLALYPVLAAIALIRSYRSAGVEEKRQVQWPLWGLMISLLSRIVTLVLSLGLAFALMAKQQTTVEWRTLFEAFDVIPTMLAALIPLSFAAAILKYRLMNIDLIIRRTVVYAILSTLIVVVYLGVVGGLGTLLIRFAGVQNQTLVVASTLVVALLFVPMRNKLQTLVDRNLFRHKYDYPEALRTMSIEARGATDTHAFLQSAAEKIQQALQNRAVVMFIERQDELTAAAKVGVSDAILGRLRVPHTFAELLDRPFDPRRRTLPPEDAAALARIDASLIVPAGTRAFIAVAPKLSGGEFDVEDIDFLRSAGDSIAMAVDRIRMQVEEADYAQARAIQQTLLPREMPRVAKLDLSGTWQPARTMGGDYYDLLKLAEHELAVCIGDVAGKGMPAALLMSGLQAAVRASASNSPRDLCERVRRVVVSSLSGGRFVTFFYATVDTQAMRLRWCNAGHNAPVLARADGSVVRLAEGGPAFTRLFRDAAYEEREMPLLPGDRLVLFTDGVSEAADGTGEQFGEQRIEELVVAADRDMRAEELQRRIVDAALSFSGGELEDDVTLVVVGVA